MAFHDDPGVREEAPKASGPRFFFRIIAQEAAALLKLNLLFLLFCLPAVTIPPALLALFQGQEPCHSVPTKAMPDLEIIQINPFFPRLLLVSDLSH